MKHTPYKFIASLSVALLLSACSQSSKSSSATPKTQPAPKVTLAPVSASNLSLLEQVRNEHRDRDLRFDIAKDLEANNDALEATLRLLLEPKTVINKHVKLIVFSRFNEPVTPHFGIYEVPDILVLDVESAFDREKAAYFLEYSESLKASRVKTEVWGELVKLADQLEKKYIRLDVDYERLSAAQILETTRRIEQNLAKVEDLSLISIADSEYAIKDTVTLNAASKGDREAEQIHLLVNKETLKTTKNRLALEGKRERLEEHLKPFISDFELQIRYDVVDQKSAEQILKFLAQGFSIDPKIQSVVLGTKNEVSEELWGTTVELDATRAIDESTVETLLK